MRPQRFLSVIVKSVPATSNNGSRVKLSCPRFKKSRTFAYDYGTGDTLYQAIKTLAENGIVPVGSTEDGKDNDILLVEFPSGLTGSPFARFFRA